MRLLDLYCGAGGASVGYARAGFTVVGVDIRPQPNYPFEFHQADALTFRLDGFDAVHASPPCHDHTTAMTTPKHGTGSMLQATIRRLAAAGLPYAVENVPGALRFMFGSYMLCGKAMGLAPLKRHRLFWTNVPMLVPPCACNHLRDQVVAVFGDLSRNDRRTRADRPSMRAGIDTARQLLGCPWMDGPELSQAVPPAYTEHVGGFLMAALAVTR